VTDQDLEECATHLERVTSRLHPARRREVLAALPAIADKMARAAQIIGPDPVEPKAKSGDSEESTLACPHCGKSVLVRLATSRER
jgi:hypothetical protein